MNRLKRTTVMLLLPLFATACVSYNAYQKAKSAEKDKNWDVAVLQYEKALEIAPDNTQYKVALDRAKRAASREHFQKGRTMLNAATTASGPEQFRLAQLASTELQITIKLDPTNQYAAVELTKALQLLEQIRRAASEQTTIEDIKKRAKASVTKAQPPQLNPASTEPITLTFPRETNVKDIYRALGNAYGINILFDQAVKDDRITIELHDVTAQQALERVMQAANHFYKVLDEKTIIVVPDNPQARRDYEDLVIRTFYLSNGDAEQVTNVVRTMIEARNVFPLKALNAITIRDTADKVLIAEKIIEANDKAKAEVVVTVELVQLDLSRVRDIGFAVSGFAGTSGVSGTSAVGVVGTKLNDKGETVVGPITGGTLNDLANALNGGFRNTLSFTLPQATYGLMKTLGNSELLANPELRISEGEKATLHIGQRIPVPVSTFTSAVTGTQGGTFAPVTSYQYQDVGIKVAMEPRVHHNQEVTLKLTVEVSNLGARIEGQPSFATRTIESTIRLKDGETNFLAGLIQSTEEEGETKTPFLGDLPFIGRLFTNHHKSETRTDLVLTMTPHIIRMPNITEDDLAPMWVGTTNNLTFRGVSPRIESQAGIDPFNNGNAPNNPRNLQLSTDGEPGNYIQPEGTVAPAAGTPAPPAGSGPSDPFRRQPTQQPQPTPAQPPQQPTGPPGSIWRQNPPGTSSSLENGVGTPSSAAPVSLATNAAAQQNDLAMLRLAPRLAPQPASLALAPGESKVWTIVGMDLDGLTTTELLLQFDPQHMAVTDVSFGPALLVNPQQPPAVTMNRETGLIRIASTDGKPLAFVSGGEVLSLRVHGGLAGETFLVLANPELRDAKGKSVVAAVSGGRARVD